MGAEGVLRITGQGVPEPWVPLRIVAMFPDSPLAVEDPGLIFRIAPHTQFLGYYRINGRGWRGPDVPDRPPEGGLRLLCQGDSSTMGLGVHEQDGWTA